MRHASLSPHILWRKLSLKNSTLVDEMMMRDDLQFEPPWCAIRLSIRRSISFSFRLSCLILLFQLLLFRSILWWHFHNMNNAFLAQKAFTHFEFLPRARQPLFRHLAILISELISASFITSLCYMPHAILGIILYRCAILTAFADCAYLVVLQHFHIISRWIYYTFSLIMRYVIGLA